MGSEQQSPDLMDQVAAILEKGMAEEAAAAAKKAAKKAPKLKLSPKQQLRHEAMVAWARAVQDARKAIPLEAIRTGTLTEADTLLMAVVYGLANYALADAPSLVRTVEVIAKILEHSETRHGLRDARIAHACELITKHRRSANKLIHLLTGEVDFAFLRIWANGQIPEVRELLRRYTTQPKRGKLTAAAILVKLNKLATANERDGGPLGSTTWVTPHNVAQAVVRARSASRKE